MWSNFDVDSIVTTHWLVGVRKNYFIPPEYELHAPLSGEHPYDAFSSGFSLSIDALEVGLRSYGGSFSLLWVKNINEVWLVEAGLSSTPRGMLSHLLFMTSAEKGKGIVELEDVPKWGYIIRELCEVEDRARADKYFASIMIQLKSVDNEDPLVPRWGHLRVVPSVANKDLKLSVNQELVTTTKHRVKEWEDETKKLWTELESLRTQQRELEQEVGVLRSILDGA
ncbi:hypothetical protein B296_00058602 [Ensete ventricosum]|uniref:Uncharacterized protein n=1 Tax=Ensete ventricosum TaxID=4639 RepID=A0A426XLI3_ENSVE|nr:hypothetical protein B296_00058602 [Ensete ventricosum]